MNHLFEVSYMKRILKISSLAFPILFMVFFVAYYIGYQRSVLDRQLLDADGVVWKNEKAEYTVETRETKPEAEILVYAIKVINMVTKTVDFDKESRFNRDMFGGGFVKAVQLDNDPELEIISWGKHERKQSFVLDFSRGQVIEIPFDEASRETKDIVSRWYDYNVTKPIETVILIVVLLGYYILYGVVWVVFRIVRKKRKTQQC